ncbi:MAG TPA: hypothetical protein ENI35_04125 [Candidatus Desulfofervidus auxilii]|uniref:Uncharacterized protein n=1 Tax=Desulfofervidus auxilii TaxID=1621989 RepID=A0A7C1VPC3_DESA2|nr:hypothetical protein BLFGPEAP_02249 [Candidatus Methanoperedenaceae archaeon GB50]HEC67983.1 hypothetical protein [Candidatus Desulfofervidus auxilii]
MRLEKLNSLSLLWGIPSKEGLKKIKKTNSVFIPEMRPYILGLKVAEGLNKEGVKPIYVTDNMLGLLFYKQKIKEVLFFYRQRQNGHFLGICGSLYVCLLSHLHQVPIKALKGEEIDLRVFDQDASTIDGCLFFKNAAVEAKDEYVPMEFIK